MSPKTKLSYTTFQRIKAEEFERFFENSRTHLPYLNHLGEIKWMAEDDAADQHEFFIYSESSIARLKKKTKFGKQPSLDKMPQSERELHIQFRKHLEERYSDGISSETTSLVPGVWEDELTPEEIEGIPITLESLEGAPWSRTFLFLLVTIVGLLAASFYFGLIHDSSEKGGIVVYSNISGASIYLDDVKIGYTDSVNAFQDVPIGEYEVQVRKTGYSTSPQQRRMLVSGDSISPARFVLQRIASREDGYLKIGAEHQDSKIFVNSEYLGQVSDLPHLTLAAGDYQVTIEKSGYSSVPGAEQVNIVAGDTSTISFSQRKLPSSYRAASASNGSRNLSGSLQISANVSGARIILNGKDSGKEASYLFTNLALGAYTVELERDGYTSFPAEHKIELSRNKPDLEFEFELVKNSQTVAIETSPISAQIYIDGNVVGTGSFSGTLSTGNHRIEFADMEGYITPEAQDVEVRPNRPLSLAVRYYPLLNMVAEVDRNGNLDPQNCTVYTGYTFNNRGFSASDEGGPEVVYHEDLEDYFWKLGFAFPFRNPKGNDALKVTLQLPHDLAKGPKYVLKIQAAASKENYPLTLSSHTEVKIKFNGTILSYYYKPEFLEDINGMEELEWDISDSVKPGLNTLEITTTDENNTFYYVKGINIRN